jgi:hypothetical protein
MNTLPDPGPVGPATVTAGTAGAAEESTLGRTMRPRSAPAVRGDRACRERSLEMLIGPGILLKIKDRMKNRSKTVDNLSKIPTRFASTSTMGAVQFIRGYNLVVSHRHLNHEGNG